MNCLIIDSKDIRAVCNSRDILPLPFLVTVVTLAPMRTVSGVALLKAFLARHSTTPTAAARAIGISHVTMLSYLKGEKRPECDRREAIEKWTSGEVPRESWRTPDEAATLDRVQPIAGTEGR